MDGQDISRKKKVIFTVIAVVLFLAMAEFLFRLVIGRYNLLGNAEKLRTQDPYKGKPWAEQYFKDIMDCDAQAAQKVHSHYKRYLLFDSTPECATQYINFSEGVRKTWNPASSSYLAGSKIYTVGMFGASTMVGLGAIDDETIPSHLSQLLNNQGNNAIYKVTNYGESSYTFTQSVMKLIVLLKGGKRFDYVIFYDGTNDIDNAYDEGEAGALYNERAIKIKLEGGTLGNLREFVKKELNSCALCKATVILFRNTPFLKDHISPYMVRMRDAILFRKGSKMSDKDIPMFAEQVAEQYKEAHYLLDALSRTYNFKYADFWQPALLYEDKMVGSEKLIANIDVKVNDSKIRELYWLTRKDVNSMQMQNFYDLSYALKERTEAVYLDVVHISGDANKVIMSEMYKHLQQQHFFDKLK